MSKQKGREIITYDGVDVEKMTKAQLVAAFRSLSKTQNNWSKIRKAIVVDEEGYKAQQ